MPLIKARNLIRLKHLAAAAVLVLGGQIAYAHNGLVEKIAVLSAQIAKSPASPDLLIRRAELYREARRWRDALADLERAERINPALTTPDLVRAHVYFDRRDWQPAIDAASRFLTRQPRHSDALIFRARAAAQLGQRRASAEDFSRALVDRPLPDLYIERARVLLRLGSDGPAHALRSLDEGINRLGPIVTLELEAIDLELQLKRYDAALARLDQVSAQSRRKEGWLARRGAVLERAGRLDEARAAYRAALDAAESLPERIQRTRASIDLVAGLRADIERLEKNVKTVHVLSHDQKRGR